MAFKITAGGALAVALVASLNACSGAPGGQELLPQLEAGRPASVVRSENGIALAAPTEDVVIQDWGGAAGTIEEITGDIRILKRLDLAASALDFSDIQTANLELRLYEAPNNPVPLAIGVNGVGVAALHPEPLQQGRYEWRTIEIPIQWLTAGVNAFVIHAAVETPNSAWAVPLRRHVLPNQSARSRDGGATWDFDGLGDGQDNGEYEIRLRLRKRARARLLSPVIKMAGSVPWTIAWRADLQHGSTVRASARTGPVAIIGSSWTAWHDLGQPTDAPRQIAQQEGHRYLQVMIALASEGISAPAVESVRLTPPPISGDARLDALNSWARYGATFGYQQPTDPQLAALRAREGLDAVVGDAFDELTQVVRLRDWVRRQFPDGDPNPYPPARADTILDWIRSGRTGGFCGQHAFVYGQALQAFGFQIRYVELGMNTPVPDGRSFYPSVHFAVEYWSPTYRKWVFMDPNKNMHAVLDGVPLSASELQNLVMESFDPALERLRAAQPPHAVHLTPDSVDYREFSGDDALRVARWQLQGKQFEVIEGPHLVGARLDYFYYVRVRLRSNDLMAPSPNVSDLTLQAMPRSEFSPDWNGMLEHEDERAIALEPPIAAYTTRDAAVFDWRMDIVDLAFERLNDEWTLRVATTWPYPAQFVAAGHDWRLESPTSVFSLPETSSDVAVTVHDTAGRAVGCAHATRDADGWRVDRCREPSTTSKLNPRGTGIDSR